MHVRRGDRTTRGRAILFDALGTLVALEPPAPRLRDELARRFRARIDLADAERAMAAEISYYRAHLDEGLDRASVAALRRRCAEVLRDALPRAAGIRGVDSGELTEVLLASLRFRAFSDALPALAAAQAHGVRLVVVSNWDFSLHEILARLEILSLVDGVLTSAEAGTRKPQRQIFEQALRIAGVRASDAIHVGDSLEEDIAGARLAGINPVLIARDGRLAPAGVPTIRSLADLDAFEP
jgi:putative hydrolase of the HAD superfamily